MNAELDRERLETIVDAVVDRLPGDWLLLGGALVALWLDTRRTTRDVDLVGMGGTLEERYDLMRLSTDLGLPPEVLNSAADFFLHQIPDWRQEIEVWKRGAVGTLWRPTPTLLVLLKSGRLSEQDLEDCAAAIERARADGLSLDVPRLLAWLDSLAPAAGALADRRAHLRSLLAG